MTTRRITNFLEIFRGGEQTDTQAGSMIDLAPVNFDGTIGDTHIERAPDDAFYVDSVGYQGILRCDLPGEFYLSGAQRPPASGTAVPAQVESDQLPHGIKTETARHDGIAIKMTVEKPQLRFDVKFGDDMALAIDTTRVADVGNAFEHQHRRQRQLCIARAEHPAMPAFKKLGKGKTVFTPGAWLLCCLGQW
jgi:hypothetical protein